MPLTTTTTTSLFLSMPSPHQRQYDSLLSVWLCVRGPVQRCVHPVAVGGLSQCTPQTQRTVDKETERCTRAAAVDGFGTLPGQSPNVRGSIPRVRRSRPFDGCLVAHMREYRTL